jgi:hypothetical protein
VGTIRATVQTEKYRGPVSKGITVTTNDPERGTIQLTLRAEILGSVSLLPGSILTVGNLRGRSAAARMVVRKEESESGTLELREVRASVPWLEVRATRVASGTEEPTVDGVPSVLPGDWILEAEVDGEPPPGNRSLTVSFATGLPREPVVSVPVQVLWRPAIRFSAPSVTLDLSSNSPPPLLVSFRPDVVSADAKISAEPAGLEARLEPANSQAMHVRLRWVGPGEPPAEGRVLVQAGSETATALVRFTRSVGSASPPR